ncbi:hypothetical protein QQF64_008897 [Cirrhinus molitorella]|uniref:Uncharacterized protein n=1 Tax=Cirrhinus molitorella TaxID=172907 RepID=A0ABR3M8W4_9TELE
MNPQQGAPLFSKWTPTFCAARAEEGLVLLIGAAADCQFTLRSADTGDISDQTSSYPVAEQFIPVGFSFGDNTVG